MYNGLTNNEVLESRKKYGSNELNRTKKDSFLKLLIGTLGDPIIKILLIALAIKTVFLFKNFDWYETIGIVIAILLASLISTISEYGSEQAFEKLQEEVSKISCKVIRNGKKQEISVKDVVVGDIVSLESGDKVPADGIVIKGRISVDESSLNGETKEAYKESIINMNLINDKNRVFKGSVVYSNTALMKVTAVGINTFYGKIALELQEKQPETPLKLRLRELARFTSRIGYIGAFLVFFSYLFKVIIINNNFNIQEIVNTVTNFPLITGQILYALTLCVTIIIVAVPEGLPMMITLVLSSNMKRMMKDNVLVRKLINMIFNAKVNDIMTGSRAMSYNFVKGFPITSRGFELETEMTIHALDKNYKIEEITVPYQDRDNDNPSKLNTISDGYKVLRTVARLFKEYKPSVFFNLIAFCALVFSICLLVPTLIGYVNTGMVEKFPSLIASGIFLLVALLLWITGIILKVINRKEREIYELIINMK